MRKCTADAGLPGHVPGGDHHGPVLNGRPSDPLPAKGRDDVVSRAQGGEVPITSSKMRRRLTAGAALAMFAAALPARAQMVPRHAVQLIVPFAPGGVADTLARWLADAWSRKRGQPVVVINRPGAGGTIAAGALVRTRPEETALMLTSQSVLVQTLLTSTPVAAREMLAAMRYASLVALQDSFLVVAAKSGLRSLGEFQARHGDGRHAAAFASLGVGSLGHVLGTTFARDLRIDVVHVPYNGSPPILQALLSGDVDFAFMAYENFRTQLAAGALAPLMVAADRASHMLPAVPGAPSLGLKSLNRGTWFAIAHAAHAEPAFVARATEEIVSILSDPLVAKGISDMGLQPSPRTGDALHQHLAAERGYWTRRMAELGL